MGIYLLLKVSTAFVRSLLILHWPYKAPCSSLLPPPAWFLCFWCPRDLAFDIPGIPTAVPPQLLIITACFPRSHFKAKEQRGGQPHETPLIVETVGITGIYLPSRRSVWLRCARKRVRGAPVFCTWRASWRKTSSRTRTKKLFCSAELR